jgi:ribosomal protein S18 acetylase RimI-like enzyme
MKIEPLQAEDIPRVASLLRECFEWLSDQNGFTPAQRGFLCGERSSEETVRTESQSRPHLVARRGGDLLGFVAISRNNIARLYIHPRFHRQGVGKALYGAAEAMIRQAGYDRVTVGALVESAAAFYRAMGMTEIGREIYEPEIFLGRKVVLLAKPLEPAGASADPSNG